MQKQINNVELTPSYQLICSDDIHSQLQENEWVSTLFDFCINLSIKGTLAETYTRGRFMQKQQMIGNLLLQTVGYVVMIFIANYKEMSGYLLFSTFA